MSHNNYLYIQSKKGFKACHNLREKEWNVEKKDDRHSFYGERSCKRSIEKKTELALKLASRWHKILISKMNILLSFYSSQKFNFVVKAAFFLNVKSCLLKSDSANLGNRNKFLIFCILCIPFPFNHIFFGATNDNDTFGGLKPLFIFKFLWNVVNFAQKLTRGHRNQVNT